MYGCETWSLTLSDEHKLRTLNNRMLRKIFGPERNEVTGQWLHKEQLTGYYSDEKIKKNEKGGEGETYRGKHMGTQRFWWGSLSEKKDNLEELGVNGRIILKRIKK